MSDSSACSSDEDIAKTGLVASRAKRSTAGNRLQSLLANIDDDELQKELLAEEAEDVEDYNSDVAESGDGDDALDSSSDGEDAGPPQEGEDEDLTGEREVRRAERAEAGRKRKATKPVLGAVKKKLKFADDRSPASSARSAGALQGLDAAQHAQPRPRKKSERASWLPAAADLPTRQSRRPLAVANRAEISDRLRDADARGAKQVETMARAARKREVDERQQKMTREERMEKARRIERENARSLRGWQEAEEERERVRREKLAAARGRGIEGPVVRWWSGGCVWEGQKMVVKRIGPRGVREEREKRAEEEKRRMVEGGRMVVDLTEEYSEPLNTAASAEARPREAAASTLPATPLDAGEQQGRAAQPVQPSQQPPQQSNTDQQARPYALVAAPDGWLAGIHDYANQQPSQARSTQPPPEAEPQALQPAPATTPYTAPSQPPTHPAPPPLRETATRTLLILPQSPSPGPKPKPPTFLPALLPPTQLTAAQIAYLTTKPRPLTSRRSSILPSPPARPACALSCRPAARYRDPRSGLAFADAGAYKGIGRVLEGGCMWSGLLGAWVGPSYGVLGRPARGVVEGFAG